MVDFDSLPLPVRREAIERLVVQLNDTPGVPDAEVGPAPVLSGRYETVFGFSPVARAPTRAQTRQLADQHDRLSPELVEISLRWLRSRSPSLEPHLIVMSAELRVTWSELPQIIDAAYPAARLLTVISTDFATTQASVTYGAFHGAGAVLAASHASPTPATVAEDMRSNVMQFAPMSPSWSGRG